MKSTLKTIRVAGFLLLATVAFASCGGNDHDHDHDGHEHHEGDGHDDHDH